MNQHGAGMRTFAAAMALALAACGVARGAEVWNIHQIVTIGDPMPDGRSAYHITSWPIINDRGDIAFVVMTEQKKPVDFSHLVCVRDMATGKLRVAVQKGMSLGGKEVVDGMAAVTMTEEGWIAAKVSMLGGAGDAGKGNPWAAMMGAGDAVVRVSPEGKLTVVAKAGAPVPGVEGGTFLTLPDTPAVGKGGRVIFSGGVKAGGAAVGGGLWRMEPDGSVKLLAMKGGVTPGVENGQYATIMTNSSSGMVSDDGSTLFHAYLKALPGGRDMDRWGVWRVNAQGTAVPVMTSWITPPLGADKQGKKGELAQFKGAGINADGAFAVAMTVNKSQLRAGIAAVDSKEEVRIVATTETPVPATGPGGEQLRFNSFENVAINSKGNVAFTAWTFGGPSGGTRICVEEAPGKLRSIAAIGEAAPGTVGRTFKFIDPPQFCATGQVAFCATLDDGKKGLWMTDRTGALKLVAMVDGKLTLLGGAVKTITDVSIASIAGVNNSGGGDGKMKSLNNKGEIVFHCFFSDKTSGIFMGYFADK